MNLNHKPIGVLMVRFRKIKKRISKPLIRLIVLWAVTVFLIQIAAPNPLVESMPESCSSNSGNCVRVALDGTSYRHNYLEPPEISASISEVSEVISNWFSEEKSGKTLMNNYDENTDTDFLHIKDNTEFLFFPDDVFVHSSCSLKNNLTVVTLQSQSRLGMGDLGVNFDRLSELILFLDQYSWSGNTCRDNN